MRKLRHEEIIRTSLSEIVHKQRHPMYVVVDNVRSIYNIGSIFRTSDGALIEKLFLCGFTPHPPRAEISKTALGATESVPWEYSGSTTDVLVRLKKESVKIAAVELTTESRSYASLSKSDFPLALVIGNEITGLSNEVIERVDFALEIPMHGIKQSLNVAVAYGIVVFECLRVLHSS